MLFFFFFFIFLFFFFWCCCCLFFFDYYFICFFGFLNVWERYVFVDQTAVCYICVIIGFDEYESGDDGYLIGILSVAILCNRKLQCFFVFNVNHMLARTMYMPVLIYFPLHCDILLPSIFNSYRSVPAIQSSQWRAIRRENRKKTTY